MRDLIKNIWIVPKRANTVNTFIANYFGHKRMNELSPFSKHMTIKKLFTCAAATANVIGSAENLEEAN